MKILQLRTMYLRNPSFKYLGVTITGNNNWNIEIIEIFNIFNHFNKGERAYFAPSKYFKSKILSRGT